MLGSVFFAGEPRVVGDTEAVDANGKPPFNYRTPTGAKPRRSAMTVPIRVDNEIRWLLDIESLTTRAFGNEDKNSVERVVRQFQQQMDLLSERVLSVALLNAIEQGTAITDRTGRVLRANRRAKDLLRLPGDRSGWGRICDYGADERSRTVLSGFDNVERQPLRVSGRAGGAGNAVLASRRDLDRDFGYSVWLFTDLRADEWQHDSHFIEATIREVARQARGPLMLAASFVKRIAEGARDISLASRAVAELDKADVTYQRIAESVEAQKNPLRARLPVLLNALLLDLMKTLNKPDADQIELVLPSHHLHIAGDGSRIDLALRMIVAAFLTRLRMSAPEERTLNIVLSRRAKLASIELSLRAARKTEARLAKVRAPPNAPLHTATIIIAAHGGKVLGAGLESSAPRMQIRLPLLEIRK
jgi:hypothetical protein